MTRHFHSVVAVGNAEAGGSERFCFPQSGSDLPSALAAAFPAESAQELRNSANPSARSCACSCGKPPPENWFNFLHHRLGGFNAVLELVVRPCRVRARGVDPALRAAAHAVRTHSLYRGRKQQRVSAQGTLSAGQL